MTDPRSQTVPAAMAGTFGTPWSLPGVSQFDIDPDGHSDGRGAFRILVSVPEAPPPEGGYGILYAIDAGWTFGTLLDAVRLQSGAHAGSGVGPTIVVGIGWPTADLIDMERRGSDLVDPVEQGGRREATLALVAAELVRRIEGALPVDPRRRMLLGHSYGGAFTLRMAFGRPDAFSHFAAGSPSVWTDPDWYFAQADQLRGRLLISIGALEDPDAPGAERQPVDRLQRLRERDMHGRACRLAERTGARLVRYDGATHGSSITPFLARAVSFLWES